MSCKPHHNPAAPDGVGTKASHLPLSEEAFAKSVTVLVGTRDAGSEWQEDYSIWATEGRRGKAGVFSAPVAAVLDALGEVLAKP